MDLDLKALERLLVEKEIIEYGELREMINEVIEQEAKDREEYYRNRF